MASNVTSDKDSCVVCPICYDTIKPDELETLTCGHKFHYDCIFHH